jgi:hypothetical protein
MASDCEQTILTEQLHLLAKLVTTFADRECRMASTMDAYGCICDFLDQSRYFFFQVTPQLYSQG